MNELWDSRAIFYRFLAAFSLFPPSKAFSLFPADLLDYPPLRLSDASHEGWILMRDYIRNHTVGEIAADHELTLDYYRLFVGPDIVLAPPWESVYRHEDRLLFGQATMQVRAYYARYGLATRWLNSEPDDHLGLELEFLAYLSFFTKQILQGEQQAELIAVIKDQQQFMRGHLLEWVPFWQEKVCTHAQTSFYRGLSIVIKTFMQEDAAFIEQFFQKLGDGRKVR